MEIFNFLKIAGTLQYSNNFILRLLMKQWIIGPIMIIIINIIYITLNQTL